MQSNSKGIGSRKHGKSGICGKNAKYKSEKARESKIEEIQREKRNQAKKLKYSSIKELFK